MYTLLMRACKNNASGPGTSGVARWCWQCDYSIYLYITWHFRSTWVDFLKVTLQTNIHPPQLASAFRALSRGQVERCKLVQTAHMFVAHSQHISERDYRSIGRFILTVEMHKQHEIMILHEFALLGGGQFQIFCIFGCLTIVLECSNLNQKSIAVCSTWLQNGLPNFFHM